MTADVFIYHDETGITTVELVRSGRLLKSMKFMAEEWNDLVNQIASNKPDPTKTAWNNTVDQISSIGPDPMKVVIAKYQRLHNAGVNCTPIPALLESLRAIRNDPEAIIKKEKLETMMEVVKV